MVFLSLIDCIMLNVLEYCAPATTETPRRVSQSLVTGHPLRVQPRQQRYRAQWPRESPEEITTAVGPSSAPEVVVLEEAGGEAIHRPQILISTISQCKYGQSTTVRISAPYSSQL